MTDDAGFSLPACMGGPVHMPTMDKLAKQGVKYNRFHTTAMCSPTRAALLTGRNHHAVGFGQVTEFANDFDGYVGELPKSATTIAQVLSEYGYDTAAFGKWHNTPTTHLARSGPFDQYPTGLGFRHFYGHLSGETGQYEPRLFENTNPIEPPNDPNYHVTEDLAAQAIKAIRRNRALTPDKPMFIYMTPGAVHAPHQVFKSWADKYKGRFDKGWEVLREETYEKQRACGWIPDSAVLNPMHDTMQRWADVPEEQRQFQTRLMEVYAGFMEHTDVQYGKIVAELEAQGMRENTLIMYIHSDNGASAEGMFGTLSELLNFTPLADEATVSKQIEVLHSDYGGLDALGGPLLENHYHHGWAWACDTPFKSTKLVAAHFGGTRTPLVVSWPRRIHHDPTPRPQFHHVIDIAPTIYDVAKITPPKTYNGIEQQPIDGTSMVYSFNDVAATGQKTTQYFEIIGSRGIYHDGWFACTFGPRVPWMTPLSQAMSLMQWTPEDDIWELYDIGNDYSQSFDLAEKEPQRLAKLKEMFAIHAARNQVYPIGGGLQALLGRGRPAQTLKEWTFVGEHDRVPESLGPKFTSGTSSITTIDVDIPVDACGVLLAVGGIGGGFTVFMDRGYLQAEYNVFGMWRYKVQSDMPVNIGHHMEVEVDMRYDSASRFGGGTIIFRVSGAEVGRGRFDKSIVGQFTASETFDIGKDLGSPVSIDYAARKPFAFNGTIHKVHIKYHPKPEKSKL